MIAPILTAYLDTLNKKAGTANMAEDTFRSEIGKRMAELERERAFAFRRYNMMQSLIQSVSGAKDEAEATEKACEALMQEVNWTGATEAQREGLKRFEPVAAALWAATQPDAGEEKAAAVEREMDAFEKWFSESRKSPFLSLMDREPLELPLVEIS